MLSCQAKYCLAHKTFWYNHLVRLTQRSYRLWISLTISVGDKWFNCFWTNDWTGTRLLLVCKYCSCQLEAENDDQNQEELQLNLFNLLVSYFFFCYCYPALLVKGGMELRAWMGITVILRCDHSIDETWDGTRTGWVLRPSLLLFLLPFVVSLTAVVVCFVKETKAGRNEMGWNGLREEWEGERDRGEGEHPTDLLCDINTSDRWERTHYTLSRECQLISQWDPLFMLGDLRTAGNSR